MTVAYSIDPASPSILAIDLTRALDRLERKILATPPDPRLRKSSHERSKTAANLEYARTLLLRLEHSSSLPSLKPQLRTPRARDSLLAQRALLKRLSDRLHELDQANDDDDSINTSSSESEDLLGEDDAPPSVAAPSSSPQQQQQQQKQNDISSSQPPPPPQSTLRNRFPPPPTNLSPTAQREAEDSLHADLTASLASMASQLKAQALATSASLEIDKEVVAQAGEGLEKSTAGMDAASRKMGRLRRMSEGKGWWGRMMLYAWIGGLWAMALGVVFVGPKLRF